MEQDFKYFKCRVQILAKLSLNSISTPAQPQLNSISTQLNLNSNYWAWHYSAQLVLLLLLSEPNKPQHLNLNFQAARSQLQPVAGNSGEAAQLLQRHIQVQEWDSLPVHHGLDRDAHHAPEEPSHHNSRYRLWHCRICKITSVEW